MAEIKEGEFRKIMGPWSAGALAAGCMIGTGIFIFVADVAKALQSPGAILSVWIVGAAIASCGALCLAELASTYPETGGIYVFLRRAFGRPVAFLYSWAEVLIMRPGCFALLAVGFAGFTADFFGLDTEASPMLAKGIAVGAIAALTIINIGGVRLGVTVQNVFTAAKILCLAGIVGVGAAFGLGLLDAHPVTIELAPPSPAEEPTLLFGIDLSPLFLFGSALVAVMWTYGGWDESPFVAEEVRDPARNLPRSILGGLWVVATLFVLVNGAYLLLLSPVELANSDMTTALDAMERALGPMARKALTFALMVSTFGAANGLALTGGRISYAAGRDHLLFRWFAHTHPRTKTPARGLILQGALTALAVLILGNPLPLLFYTGLAYWIFAGATAVALVVLRYRDPDRERPFRVWFYPVLPALFLLAAIGMAISVIVKDWTNALATVAILDVGAGVYMGVHFYQAELDRTHLDENPEIKR